MPELRRLSKLTGERISAVPRRGSPFEFLPLLLPLLPAPAHGPVTRLQCERSNLGIALAWCARHAPDGPLTHDERLNIEACLTAAAARGDISSDERSTCLTRLDRIPA